MTAKNCNREREERRDEPAEAWVCDWQLPPESTPEADAEPADPLPPHNTAASEVAIGIWWD